MPLRCQTPQESPRTWQGELWGLQERQEEELPNPQVPVVFSEGIHSRAVQHFPSNALPTVFSVLFMTLHTCPGRRKGEGWGSIHTLCFKHPISFLPGSHAALSNLWREICCSTGQLQAAALGPGAELPPEWQLSRGLSPTPESPKSFQTPLTEQKVFW